MTVLEGIQKSAEFLTKKGVDSPRLQAELLLAHVLKMPRMKLYLSFEQALTDAETDAFRELIRRRSQREPLQHITGSTSFCGLEISVNRHVLVPRPETEMLAELGWKWLGERRNPKSESGSTAGDRNPNAQNACALDFGTGSGCIAIALAAKYPQAKIVALDISAEALDMAKQNAAKNDASERIEFLQGGGFEVLARGTQFDLIISNPPYIPTAEIETLEPEVRDYDPRGALDGGADGLDFYRRFAVEARPFLKSGGKLMLEFGDGQAAEIRKIFEAQNWIVEAIHADYTQRERIFIARHE